MFRESRPDRVIDTTGTLLTGESFSTVQELKKILVTQRRLDFYRCLTEKLLTYALGRGLEDYDVYTVDAIVDRLDKENGRSSVLISGIIESVPFSKSAVPRPPGAIHDRSFRTHDTSAATPRLRHQPPGSTAGTFSAELARRSPCRRFNRSLRSKSWGQNHPQRRARDCGHGYRAFPLRSAFSSFPRTGLFLGLVADAGRHRIRMEPDA